jgi:hypothetical protein
VHDERIVEEVAGGDKQPAEKKASRRTRIT